MRVVMRCVSLSVLALLSFVLLPGAARLQAADEDELTKIQVKVLTLGGSPVDRASVVVQFAGGRSIKKLGRKVMTRWEVRTNQDGMAKVPSMPRGNVQVQVIAKGYQTFGQIYEVNEAERLIEVKLNPPQPQYSAH